MSFPLAAAMLALAAWGAPGEGDRRVRFGDSPVRVSAVPAEMVEGKRGQRDELESRIRAVCKAALPLVYQLEGLRGEYGAAQTEESLEDLERRRRRLIDVVAGKLEFLSQLQLEEKGLMEAETYLKISSLVAEGMRTGAVPKGAAAVVASAFERNQLRHEVQGFRIRADTAIRLDDAAFSAAREMVGMRSRQRAVLRALKALGLLAGGAAAWALWRRRRSLPVLLTPRGAAQVARDVPLAALPTTLQPGALLGENYRVLEVLGQGGVGTVFRAEDLALKRTVAIKRLRGEIHRDEEERRGLIHEAQVVAGLKHPHIVQIYTVLEEGGDLFLVFELLRGQPLSALLAESGPIPLERVRRVIGEVASALDFAHGRGIIHRDLKPSNVLLDGDIAKVSDFGLAHQARHDAAKETWVGNWGSPAYMAPEQELGQVSIRSDVFSAGVCAYEMLTGRLPFSGPDFLAQKKGERPERPSRLVVGLPAAVDEALARVLESDPARRFASVGDFARALGRG